MWAVVIALPWPCNSGLNFKFVILPFSGQRLMMDLEADDLVPDSSTESDVTTEVAQDGLESDEEEEYRVTREDLIGEYQSMLEEREELQQRR